MIAWLELSKVLGFFLSGVALTLAFPLCLAWMEGDQGLVPLLVTMAAGLLLGLLPLAIPRREHHEITRREGFLVVTLAWVIVAALGALPFYLSPHFPSYTDAYFETMSGFTTTGATVLTDIEGLPRSLHLWRSMTHWLGGMGIIVLGIAVLPLLGTGGMELYRAEFSGARSEKLKPRIAETALALWKIYVVFSLANYLALRFAGMSEFDAVCHAFATMATGGFSTRAQSIESFSSPAIEYVTVLFMLMAGINFTQHHRLCVGREWKGFFRDVEIRFYILTVLAGTLAMAATLLNNSTLDLEKAFRSSLFQVVSIMTTTGFSSANFELWPYFAGYVLLVLMFIGGCTGSTAGGMKVVRIVMLFRVIAREFHRLVEKRGVFTIRLEGRAVGENTISSLLNLVYLAFILNFSACLLLTAFGIDLITAFSAVAACMFNIGPGLGDVGPADNYAHLPGVVKWVLSFCMLAGRLEFYTILVVMTPMFWRK